MKRQEPSVHGRALEHSTFIEGLVIVPQTSIQWWAMVAANTFSQGSDRSP